MPISLPLWLLTTPSRSPEELDRSVPEQLDAQGQVADTLSAAITAVDLVGVFFFAVSGAILAVRKGYDIVGSLLLALMVGTGGGVLRDLIVDQGPPAAFQNPWYLILPALASLVVFVRILDGERGRHAVMAFDAIGLAVYCVVGTRVALVGGLAPLSAVVLGLMTAVGGGLLRDVVAGEPPAVFGGRGWYALPALAGASLTAALGAMEWLSVYTSAAVMVAVVALRAVSLRREWMAPGAEVTGETQRQRLDPHDEPPVPDVRDRISDDGEPAESGEDGEPAESADDDGPAESGGDGGSPPRTSATRPRT